MIAGARVEVAPYKRSPTDFVLWKPSAPGEPAWDSPWGRGRPGWHLECSAMSWKHLGEIFDIHGGGIDLVFPHHENEIAQTCSAFGHDVMANVWMHNGHLQVEGEKMSKSLGNFVTIHELLHTDKFGGRSWPGEVLRLALLRTHYRQPIDFTLKGLEEADKELETWAEALNFPALPPSSIFTGPEAIPSESVNNALADDMNTPKAIAELRALYSSLRHDPEARREMLQSCEFFGLLRGDRLLAYGRSYVGDARQIAADLGPVLNEIRVAYLVGNTDRQTRLTHELNRRGVQVEIQRSGLLKYEVTGDLGLNVESLVASRNAARAAKNWKESDRIRHELAAIGITLKDNKDGTTTWKLKR
jgi:cysteinyl-tRNA synthetase